MSLFRVRCEDYHTYITLRYGGAMVVPPYLAHSVSRLGQRKSRRRVVLVGRTDVAPRFLKEEKLQEERGRCLSSTTVNNLATIAISTILPTTPPPCRPFQAVAPTILCCRRLRRRSNTEAVSLAHSPQSLKNHEIRKPPCGTTRKRKTPRLPYKPPRPERIGRKVSPTLAPNVCVVY